MDVNKTARTVTIRNPAKNGRPRQIRVSEKYINILDRQPQNGIYVFCKNPETILKQIGKNLEFPLKPRAHSSQNSHQGLVANRPAHFRHFCAAKLYLQTRDIRYVQKKMGHKA